MELSFDCKDNSSSQNVIIFFDAGRNTLTSEVKIFDDDGRNSFTASNLLTTVEQNAL